MTRCNTIIHRDESSWLIKLITSIYFATCVKLESMFLNLNPQHQLPLCIYVMFWCNVCVSTLAWHEPHQSQVGFNFELGHGWSLLKYNTMTSKAILEMIWKWYKNKKKFMLKKLKVLEWRFIKNAVTIVIHGAILALGTDTKVIF